MGETVTLNASESTDQGTITDYKWDLNGSGKYATDTGATPTVEHELHRRPARTRSAWKRPTTTASARARTITVTVLEQAAASYSEAVQSTPGLLDYYKLDEPAGPTILDSKGLSAGTISGGTFGLPGAIENGTAVGFNGTSDSGAIPLNLSGTSQVTWSSG